VLFYLLVYAFTTAGAFGVITLCERARDEAVEVADYAGLARRHPLLAAALGLFLLSLVGIPPLAASSASSTCSARRCAPATSGSRSSAY